MARASTMPGAYRLALTSLLVSSSGRPAVSCLRSRDLLPAAAPDRLDFWNFYSVQPLRSGHAAAQGHPMSRVVLVSNRVMDLRKAAQAGGVAVALADVVRSRSALWFGWNGEIRAERPARPGRARRTPRHRHRCRQPTTAATTWATPTRCCGRCFTTGSTSPQFEAGYLRDLSSTSTGGLPACCSRCCAPTTSSGCTTIT